MIEIEIIKDARKARLKNSNVFERKHEFKTDIQRSKVLLQNSWRRFGSHNYSYIYREVGNFIGFKF
jgi:hypothetical protein